MQRPSGLRQTHNGRRENRINTARKSRFLDHDIQMPGLKGDLTAVKAAAEESYQTRRQQSHWQMLLPPESGLMEKATKFRDYAEKHLRDLHIPERLLTRETTGLFNTLKEWRQAEVEEQHPTTAWIIPMPVYPGYDLVILTEHVGGRARKTALLWAEEQDLRCRTYKAEQLGLLDVARS